MDGPDGRTAAPVACRFAAYEVRRGDRWELVRGGVPAASERIRSVAG
jgi:hypothetical protein